MYTGWQRYGDKINGTKLVVQADDAVYEYDVKEYKNKPRKNPGIGSHMGFVVREKKDNILCVSFTDPKEPEDIKKASVRRAVNAAKFLMHFGSYIAEVELIAYTKAGVHVKITTLKGDPPPGTSVVVNLNHATKQGQKTKKKPKPKKTKCSLR